MLGDERVRKIAQHPMRWVLRLASVAFVGLATRALTWSRRAAVVVVESSRGTMRVLLAHGTRISTRPHTVVCTMSSVPTVHVILVDLLCCTEQHLQAVGSDCRLLALLVQLRQHGALVSLLFRKPTPEALRVPSTADLARLIGARSRTAHALGGESDPPLPPAIYELGDTPTLSVLLGRGECHPGSTRQALKPSQSSHPPDPTLVVSGPFPPGSHSPGRLAIQIPLASVRH